MSTRTIRTTCSYCSVGCNLDVTLEDGKPVKLMPAGDHPVNLGKSCPKGFHLLTPFEAEDRATTPYIRGAGGELEPAGWDAALDLFVQRFKEILETHGPESAAFLSTGQIPTEEMAFLGALGKFGMGMVHGDGNTRQCMATAAVAYKQAFGFDAPPFTYTDFEESDLLIFVGANPVISHPVMWNRVKRNEKERKIVVLDPRATKTAREADRHLPVYPKSDLTVLYAVINELIRRDWIDREYIQSHTEGFEELAEHVSGFSLADAARASGVEEEQLEELVRDIHEREAVSVWWTMGVNQSHQAVRTAQAIINLCLITGNIGRPGTGPNSITGQANAMGSRLYSNTTSLFALRDFTKEEDRRKTAELLGIPEERIPQQNSLPYSGILEQVARGRIKGLWIIATNPGHSWINKTEFFEELRNLDFLVVQDLYADTETARAADLVLPAAGSGEKDGSFINSERRFGVVQKVQDPPGEAKPDFEIFRMIADRWGCGELLSEWSSPEAVFRILQRSSRGRPCDITGIRGYREILESGGIQWPYPEESRPEGSNRRLFAEGPFFTESGRAKLLFDPPEPLPEHPDEDYPFLLLTGRGTTYQWHTQTRTGKVPMLNKLSPSEAYVEIHPEDARRYELADGDTLRVSSRRAEVRLKVKVSDSSPPGELFIPMHYEEANWLTYPAFDPYSFEPAYKAAAVRIEKDETAHARQEG
jgi:assimilatory nitrate reductase catalytic subunit